MSDAVVDLSSDIYNFLYALAQKLEDSMTNFTAMGAGGTDGASLGEPPINYNVVMPEH